MKTNIETDTIIATYEDSRQMRDEMVEYIIGVFTENRFSSLEIIESGEDDNLVVALEKFLNFQISYK